MKNISLSLTALVAALSSVHVSGDQSIALYQSSVVVMNNTGENVITNNSVSISAPSGTFK